MALCVAERQGLVARMSSSFGKLPVDRSSIQWPVTTSDRPLGASRVNVGSSRPAAGAKVRTTTAEPSVERRAGRADSFEVEKRRPVYALAGDKVSDAATRFDIAGIESGVRSVGVGAC